MELSSGGVIYKDGKYLLLKYGLGHWGLVKGHIEKNEKIEEAFIREAKEETGIPENKLKIINGFKERIQYYFKNRGKTIYKEVIYLLAESKTYNVTLSHEHKDYKWLEYEEALKTITHQNVLNVLKKAHKHLNQ